MAILLSTRPVLFATLVLLALSGSARGSGRQNAATTTAEKCYARNLYNSLMFKCKRPQPRAYKSSEVIGELYTEGEYIKPCMTVLHRCDAHSGCCMHAEGMTCAPKESAVVRLDFKIRPKFARGERLVTILARNHTACACVDERLAVQEENIALRVLELQPHEGRGEDQLLLH